MPVKVVFGLKDGRSAQKELADDASKTLWGKKIGDTVAGESIGCSGYEFLVTGGSDYCGIPMRKDVQGAVRKKILAVKGTGLKQLAKGIRVRFTVCGNTIHPKIAQVNMRVVKEGNEPLVAPKEDKTAAKKEEPKK